MQGVTDIYLSDLPHFSGPGFHIVNGDCMEAMEELIGYGVEVDAVITDPPYGINVDKNNPYSFASAGEKKENPVDWDSDLPIEWLEPSFRIMRPGAQFVSFCDSRAISDLWRAVGKHGQPQRMFYWCKSTVMPQPHPRYASCVETAVIAKKAGEKPFFSAGGAAINYWIGPRAMGNDRTDHPTQKNLDLMRKLVRDLVPEGGLVLDPFGGSGTTAVAALLEGRRSITIERDPEYFEIAKRRVSKWYNSDKMRQMDLI